MRHTRSKQIRKTLQFYERIIPGFPRTVTSSTSTSSTASTQPLYHILLDGTFIVHSYKYHIPFIERIYKLLGLRWYHHGHDHDHHEEDERHGNDQRNHNMNKKLIQFYVCQSTVTELQTIRNTMRQQQLQKKLRKQLKKKTKKKKSDTNIDIPINDNDDSNINEDHQADNGEDDNVKDIDDYLLQAIEFCKSQPHNSDERMNVIILPSVNAETLASSNCPDDLSQNETPITTKASNHQSRNRTNRRPPPLSSASSDLWYYLRQSSSSNSSSTTSSGITKHSKPLQLQHYMIATQDPTLLYYCRHHTHASSSMDDSTTTTNTATNQSTMSLPIPILRYNIPTMTHTTSESHTKSQKGCGVLVLDPPSSQYMKQYQYMEHGKWFQMAATTSTTTTPSTNAGTFGNNMNITLDEPGKSRNSTTTVTTNQRYQPKKAKGPNPLSCKKKKSETTNNTKISNKRPRTTK